MPTIDRASKVQVSERTAEYDHDYFRQFLNLDSTFRRLKIEKIPEFFIRRHTFDYLKYYMLQRIENLFYLQIELLQNMETCSNLTFSENTALVENLFSWGLDEFMQRRRFSNIIYIDVLKMESNDNITAFKFQCDLNQLAKYMSLIFDGAYSNMFDKAVDIFQEVESPINATRKLIYKIENMSEEMHANQKKFLTAFNELLLMSTMKRNSVQESMKTQLERRIMNSHIWDPIETRYQINWYRMKTVQCQYRSDLSLGNYEKEIQKLERLQNAEQVCNRSCMDYLYSSIGDLKNRINDMQNKYDVDCEAMDNRLTHKRIQIDKLKEQRQYLMEQIQRFHEEIEAMAIRLEKLALRNERKQQMLLMQKSRGRKGRKHRAKGQKKGK